jgi:putative ABC transport system permease protein
VSFLTWILTGFDALTLFLTSVLVGVIAIGIMNAMWTSVRERTREVGTMRAIGMSRPKVLILFLLEALLLGLMASGVGATLGAITAIGLDVARIRIPSDAAQSILLSDTLNLSVQPHLLLASVVFLTLLTTAAAAWPSMRAATLRPVKALQHVE